MERARSRQAAFPLAALAAHVRRAASMKPMKRMRSNDGDVVQKWLKFVPSFAKLILSEGRLRGAARRTGAPVPAAAGRRTGRRTGETAHPPQPAASSFPPPDWRRPEMRAAMHLFMFPVYRGEASLSIRRKGKGLEE